MSRSPRPGATRDRLRRSPSAPRRAGARPAHLRRAHQGRARAPATSRRSLRRLGVQGRKRRHRIQRRAARDAGRGTRDKGQGTRDKGQRTRDTGHGAPDMRRRTRDTRRQTRCDASMQEALANRSPQRAPANRRNGDWTTARRATHSPGCARADGSRRVPTLARLVARSARSHPGRPSREPSVRELEP